MSHPRWILAIMVVVGAGVLLHPRVRERLGLTRLPVLESLRETGRASQRLLSHPALLTQPGPLATPHRGEPELDDCMACHSLTGGISRDGCLDCHEEVGARIAEKRGYHGRYLTDDCAECHVDHDGPLVRFDLQSFNHDLSLYHLDGAHIELECATCHAPDSPQPRSSVNVADLRFVGLAFAACSDCHEDPHAGELTVAGRECRACHDEHGWTDRHLLFRHEDSDYGLHGAHAEVACRDCHVPPRDDAPLGAAAFVGLGRDCAACHEDPHGGQFTDTACESCHDEHGFTGAHLVFESDPHERYPLVGAHRPLDCADCHAPPEGGVLAATTFRGRATDCAACHEDPHAGQFQETSCASCHDENGFTGTPPVFASDPHEGFPLTGAHRAAACVDCHAPARPDAPLASATLRGTPTDCRACHEDPHEDSLAERACTECHSADAWKGSALSFDHQTMSAFPLDGAHSPLACSACHATQVYRPAPTDCADCHVEQADALRGLVAFAGVEHAMEPSPHAKEVGCLDCHDNSAPHQSAASHAARCADCHTPHHAELHLARTADRSSLQIRIRRLLAQAPDDEASEELEAYLRVGSHDHMAIEPRLRALLERLQR